MTSNRRKGRSQPTHKVRVTMMHGMGTRCVVEFSHSGYHTIPVFASGHRAIKPFSLPLTAFHDESPSVSSSSDFRPLSTAS
ncbi:hypothetical protein K466DRAFT_587359 [Polyporus arcularius HHB13444]|uniref:Uncharacterized protein n=1 Tax=Polyporus arcularius HHB13444 TaxID=1314778 RepID=A0A5C3PJY5_9APHY|nr:hypothetical protein K466DRAFT_587359 [Polyporus arcularius HHB13444]